MRTKSTKPKRNIWTDTDSPYGSYKGAAGSPDQWKDSFEQVWDGDKISAQNRIDKDSPWFILGIVENSSIEEIKLSFRTKAKIHHPDKGGNRDEFEKVLAAYYILTN